MNASLEDRPLRRARCCRQAARGENCRSHTSVCRSMMSCPTRGMVVPAFSHSTESTMGSRSLRTHAGGDCCSPRTPSHGLSRGPCCLSCWGTKRRLFNTGVSHQPIATS
ncbi:hypothetical protein EYF80_029805 [Liparis tanakae]|uniref:Uncharacterized protein n=1 Tax=Liparis tanakae TaxID=230148 RepID=A0A4Z2H4E5_9TELE|nr:hypothetical protein EYF80_029805 [Liparis tanakae]